VSAQLTADGSYRVTGIPTGPAVVTVGTSEYKGFAPPPRHLWKNGRPPAGSTVYVPTPPRYEKKETSPLRQEVSRGSTQYDVVLE
jgi:hypothetical protein